MAKDKKEFSVDSLLEMLTSMIPGFISDLPDKIYNSVDGMFGGFLSTILSSLGWKETVDEYKQKAGEITNEFISGLDQDLVIARSGTDKAITQFFSKTKTTLSLDESVLASIQKSTQTVAADFFKANIPDTDDQGRPIAAYSAAITYRATLVANLKGDGSTSVGLLSPNIPKDARNKEAERIATLITGVPADATVVDLVATPPTTGIAATLAHIQTLRHAEGFVKESLTEADSTMKADATLLASAVTNQKVTGGDDVKTNTPPIAGSNPNKAVVSK